MLPIKLPDGNWEVKTDVLDVHWYLMNHGDTSAEAWKVISYSLMARKQVIYDVNVMVICHRKKWYLQPYNTQVARPKETGIGWV